MSSRDKKDARRIQADFEFEGGSLGGHSGHPRRDPREPESSHHNLPPIGASSARPNGVNRRMEGFGATLTSGNSKINHDADAGQRRSPSPSSGRGPATAEYVQLQFANTQELQLILQEVSLSCYKIAVVSFKFFDGSACCGSRCSRLCCL